MGQKEYLTLMKEKAAAVQMKTADVKNVRSALEYAVDLTIQQNGSVIAAPGLRGDDLAELRSLCEAKGITVVVENLRDHIGTLGLGLTMADWGIAETATLVMDSTAEDFRIATMLSETHVAILAKSRIVLDAMSLEPELTATLKGAPKYLAFISGASRTADIERVLTIGVHGPQELHLLLLEEDK